MCKLSPVLPDPSSAQRGTGTQTPLCGAAAKAVTPTPGSNLRRTCSMHHPITRARCTLRRHSSLRARFVARLGKVDRSPRPNAASTGMPGSNATAASNSVAHEVSEPADEGQDATPRPVARDAPPNSPRSAPSCRIHQTGWSIKRFVSTARHYCRVKLEAGRRILTAATHYTTTSARCKIGRASVHQFAPTRVEYLDSAGFAALDRLLAKNAILIVLSPDSFTYRVATLMCMPIHYDAETARRTAVDGES
jgi:hypothetical protein